MKLPINSLAIAAVTLLVALAAQAQPIDKVYRIGMLNLGSPPPAALYDPRRDLVVLLREIGYVEGRNAHFERRYAGGRPERLSQLASELVRLKMDVIVAAGGLAVQAAHDATKTIPIVIFIAGQDPVDLGLTNSLARSGANLTGVVLGEMLAGKRLELLREAVPAATTIAMLFVEEGMPQVQEARQVAARLGVKLVAIKLESDDYEKAFAAMRSARVEALLVSASPTLHASRDRIIELAARHRIPAMYQFPEHVEEGGLMAYGMSGRWASGRVVHYVDRVLKGAKAADLPIEQTTKVTLAVNLKTAQALGLTIPQSVLLRADEVRD